MSKVCLYISKSSKVFPLNVVSLSLVALKSVQQILKMDPDELEFIGENKSISVIPNFNFEPIHLISGSIGECK